MALIINIRYSVARLDRSLFANLGLPLAARADTGSLVQVTTELLYQNALQNFTATVSGSSSI